MEECVRAMQQTLRAAPSIKKRVKSVYAQRNLGTIKERKQEKKEGMDATGTSEQIMMRILRMRYVIYPTIRLIDLAADRDLSDHILKSLLLNNCR